jgi:hypothetical protein
MKNSEKLKKISINYFNKKITMRSVLISTDFIYKEDGTLHSTEINTNTRDDITSIGDLNNDNFVQETSDFFEHILLDSFMKEHEMTKIICISRGGDDRLFKSFCNYYEYEYEHVLIGENQITIPDVEDQPSVLILRIAYDTYALIDDLYARDNYEFHDLIKNENFASPVYFKENDLNTITSFESSQDGKMPNYLIKARTPGYNPYDYPKGYRLDDVSELEILKENLGYDEYIQKYEYNQILTPIDGRTHFLRTMSIVYGSELNVLNLIFYKSLNSVSMYNEKLVYPYEIDTNKRLDNLFMSIYYPTYWSKTGLSYHSDMTDKILRPDNTTTPFSEMKISDEVKYIFFNRNLSNTIEQPITILDNIELGVSNIVAISNSKQGIFVNLKVYHEEYGEFSLYDGAGNTYLLKKMDTPEDTVLWTKGGLVEEGDQVMIYDKVLNKVIPIIVTEVYFDIKDMDLYLLTLEPNPEFLVQLDDSNDQLYLIQHNGCSSVDCYAGAGSCVRGTLCIDCGKSSDFCINCGGSATITCAPA